MKQIISTAVAAVLFFATTQPSRAESPSSAVHRPVNASDLMGGYIPEGTRAEVEGFIGAQDGVVMFKYHPLSAQYPVTIVTSSLSRDLLERVAARCAWDGTSAGMCEGTVRGTVMSKASRSLLADDIIIK